MNRRSTALVVATVCLIALFGVAFLAPMPYVVLSPGVTENTLGAYHGKDVISIRGHKTYPTSGGLSLTTVLETSPDYSLRLPQVLRAWFSDDQIVLPRDLVYPPNQSVQQVEQQSNQEMLDSQSAAVFAGLHEAGIKLKLQAKIASITAGAPADGVLKVGDIVTSVNGKPVSDPTSVGDAIRPLPVGSQARIAILRDGKPQTLTMKTVAVSDQDPNESRVGVTLDSTFTPPFPVDITLGQQIGGPSAGLMFSLGIYDKLTPGSLTGGRLIAGTGTISQDGSVGEIGGIQQKMAAAYAAGNRVFLAPAGNCDEAAASSLAGQIQLVKVSTLDGAVHDLEALAAGRGASLPGCS